MRHGLAVERQASEMAPRPPRTTRSPRPARQVRASRGQWPAAGARGRSLCWLGWRASPWAPADGDRGPVPVPAQVPAAVPPVVCRGPGWVGRVPGAGRRRLRLVASGFATPAYQGDLRLTAPPAWTSGGRACGRMRPRCADRVETQRRVVPVELDDAAAWRAYRGFYRQGSKYLLSAGPTGAMLPRSIQMARGPWRIRTRT